MSELYYGEEYIYEREEELLDYLRNNLTDPLTTRGVNTSDSFTATGGSDEEFTLTKPLVKNIQSVTKEGSTLRRGEDYLVTYGEDGEDAPYDKTIVTIRSTTADDAIVITYHYGECLIHEGYGVQGKQLPLCFLQQLVNNQEYTGLGEGFDSGKSQWVLGSYVLEIRDKYKRRCKKKAHEAFNVIAQFRQSNPFRVNIVNGENIQDIGWDEEKKAHVYQFTIRIKWEVPFE